jgi:hypothetical protein
VFEIAFIFIVFMFIIQFLGNGEVNKHSVYKWEVLQLKWGCAPITNGTCCNSNGDVLQFQWGCAAITMGTCCNSNGDALQLQWGRAAIEWGCDAIGHTGNTIASMPNGNLLKLQWGCTAYHKVGCAEITIRTC